MNGGILYYTCLTHRDDIEMACRAQLEKARPRSLEFGTISRGKPINFGDWNIVITGERSPLMMHRQILAGLENIKSDYVFLCESDVLYHPSHFDFIPHEANVFYYNTNVWKVRFPDGHAVWTDDLQQVSGICANRELLLDFYTRRVAQIEQDGFDRHYEPGGKLGDYKTENWHSLFPNVDIRHEKTITKSKWSCDDFRNKRYTIGWRETEIIPGWGRFTDFFAE